MNYVQLLYAISVKPTLST